MKKQILVLLAGLLFSTLSMAQEAQTSEPAHKTLRKREHNVAVQYLSSNITTEVDGVSGNTQTGTGRLVASYGYDLGRFQIGGAFGTSRATEDQEHNDVVTFSIVGRVNIIMNKPGNDWIPYAYFDVGRITGSNKTVTPSIESKGSGSELGVGMDWYPFGELFAFRATLGRVNIFLDSDNGTASAKSTSSGGQFTVGSVLSF